MALKAVGSNPISHPIKKQTVLPPVFLLIPSSLFTFILSFKSDILSLFYFVKFYLLIKPDLYVKIFVEIFKDGTYEA